MTKTSQTVHDTLLHNHPSQCQTDPLKKDLCRIELLSKLYLCICICICICWAEAHAVGKHGPIIPDHGRSHPFHCCKSVIKTTFSENHSHSQMSPNSPDSHAMPTFTTFSPPSIAITDISCLSIVGG